MDKLKIIINITLTLMLSILDVGINCWIPIPANINTITKRYLQDRMNIDRHFNAYMISFCVATIILIWNTNIDQLLTTSESITNSDTLVYSYFCVAMLHISEYFLTLAGLWNLFGVKELLNSVNYVFPKDQMNKWAYTFIVYICPIPYVILYTHETTCVTSSCWIPSQYTIIIKVFKPVISCLICSMVMLTLTAITLYRRKNIATCSVKPNHTKTITSLTLMATTLVLPMVIHGFFFSVNHLTIIKYNSFLGCLISLLRFTWTLNCYFNKRITTSSATTSGIVRFHQGSTLDRTHTTATVTLPDSIAVV